MNADITKLFQLLSDQNMWEKNPKNYCELRHFLILRLKTGIDESNFNVAGNRNPFEWYQF